MTQYKVIAVDDCKECGGLGSVYNPFRQVMENCRGCYGSCTISREVSLQEALDELLPGWRELHNQPNQKQKG